MSGHRTAVIFSSDEAFAPLAKGLVGSIVDHADTNEFALHLVDIGCSDATKTWMLDRGVSAIGFDRKRFLTVSSNSVLKDYQDAQLCRPFLPQLAPGFDTYIWIDSDIWIQDLDSLRLYENLSIDNRDKIVISPLIDVSYSYFYKDSTEFCAYNNVWFTDAYGPTVAKTYSNRVVLSSGLFALRGNSPLWSRWAEEIRHILRRQFSSHDSLHLFEQTALNYLAYATGDFVPVSARHNYNCHIGNAIRLRDRVVVGNPPHEDIGIVHLSASGRMMMKYLDNGLLYKEGAYLTDREIEKAKMISHY